MDALSRLLTFVEDLRELPHFRRVGAAMRAAGAAGFPTCGQVIRARAEAHPERVFLRFEDETVTFGDYNRGVNRFADLLRRAGVERGAVVAVMMENSPWFLMAEGAIAKRGAIGALINTSLRGAALRHVLHTSTARLILADAACAAALAELEDDDIGQVFSAEVLVPRQQSLSEALAASSDAEPELAPVRLGDVMLYIYTSGTTGYPKPAIIRHARFSMGGQSLRVVLELEEGDCSYAPTPLYHGYSNFVGFAPALHAGTAFASRRKFSASRFLDDVTRHGATHFMYVGELCRYLLRQPPSPRDRAHRLRVATGPGLRPDIWREFVERFGIDRVLETYGQTEANVSLMNRRGRVGSIGRAAPFTHRQLKLVRYDVDAQVPVRDAAGRCVECAAGEAGELISEISAKAAMSFDGYANRADNEAKLLRDCFAPGDLYLRTGDVLRRDRSGYYYFVDRIGDTFRWKGENVSTAEIAELLNGAPGVVETAVYGVRVPHADGRAGMALVVLEEGREFPASDFYAHCQRVLPAYAQPLFVRVSPSMDVTGTLKHRKGRLRDEGFDLGRVADPLYFRDDRARTFVPFTEESRDRLERGALHL